VGDDALTDQRLFTLDEARAELPRVVREAAEVIELRADLVDATTRHRHGDASVNLADVKAREARLSEIVDGFTSDGIEVKGIAPLLLDFPSLLDGQVVLLCWLEGETALEWYHDPEHGFSGRRRLPD
jgi:hypothetical protein